MARKPIEIGGFIQAIVTIIESVAAGEHNPEHELYTRLAILDAVAAEIIWGLGKDYDADVIITRHADNVAEMISQMVEE